MKELIAKLEQAKRDLSFSSGLTAFNGLPSNVVDNLESARSWIEMAICSLYEQVGREARY